ncbi:MAG: histidinol dehydrogenase [Bacteroidetes bacterium]|nr:MAG: histidinol dehydrogenase [Bacteroidota bacterium]
MQKLINPKRKEWDALCTRPSYSTESLTERVSEIIAMVEARGDKALIELSALLEGANLKNLAVSSSEIEEAKGSISEDLKKSIDLAISNLTTFHSRQIRPVEYITTSKGVTCWRKGVGMETVGLYIPGGSAPLFSTILMLGVPAKLAGCQNLILCTPPNASGTINSAILYAASILGIQQIFKVGGAQAIAAMAIGTETIPKVNKIFGPGNQYVTKAKELVSVRGTAIDMPAGPSEVLIIADESSVPSYVAADLLSQAEHGPDSQVILLSTSDDVLNETLCEVERQVMKLPRSETAMKALDNSRAILLRTLDDCMQFSNIYAPEHLILAVENPSAYAEKVVNAGSVFLGNYSCESAGDYASGTNHTLPTNGFAKAYSGVSVDSFTKYITYQELSREGIQNIGPAIEIMAEAEGLLAHKRAVSIRLKDVQND